MPDPIRQWQRLRSEAGPDLKLFRARFDYMLNPRNAATERMLVLEAADASNVVAVTPDEHIIFVRQYRFGIGDYTLELPGGLIDEGEDPGVAARRELREETGGSSDDWAYLGRIASNPVFMDAYVHHWTARDVRITHPQTQDEGEDLSVLLLPLAEVRRRFFNGEFDHPHTVNALLLFFRPLAS